MLSKPFKTTQEVAELFRVNDATVRNWIKDGELRAVRLGREFRVSVKDLENFVDLHLTDGPKSS